MSERSTLSPEDIERFVLDGFVRIDEAFSRELAEACREILWDATGCREDAPSTWASPVVRVGEMSQPPFGEAVNTARLTSAYDSLVGSGRWAPRESLGTFPIRFPSPEDPGDCGWHVDMSFGWENEPDFMKWRVNAASKGRALLMLFLFSDVGEHDAPTRIRVGSHLSIARRLAPHGDEGLTLAELAEDDFASTTPCPEAIATGMAGTVYLCHPLLVHSAQPHRGSIPRFMAQPALLPAVPIDPMRSPDASPVERAIQLALRS